MPGCTLRPGESRPRWVSAQPDPVPEERQGPPEPAGTGARPGRGGSRPGGSAGCGRGPARGSAGPRRRGGRWLTQPRAAPAPRGSRRPGRPTWCSSRGPAAQPGCSAAPPEPPGLGGRNVRNRGKNDQRYRGPAGKARPRSARSPGCERLPPTKAFHRQSPAGGEGCAARLGSVLPAADRRPPVAPAPAVPSC